MYSEPADYYRDCLRTLAPDAPGEWPKITRHYQDRAYHNLDHLREMLRHLARLPSDFAPVPAEPSIPLHSTAAPLFGLALVYHDIIYRAGRKDNEARSADLLEQHLQNLNQHLAAATYCRRLIMATKTHQPSADDGGEEALLIDLDLAVLARDAAGYDDYAKAVRHEFRKYPGFLYRPGRKKALRHFLEQDHIYHTIFFRERYETRARENLHRELDRL